MATLTAEKKKAAPRNGRPVPELLFGDLWEFDPAPESADPRLKARYDLFIGGEFVAPRSGKYFDSISPANEQKLAEIALAGPADVDAAYAAAAKAHAEVWARLPGRERGKYLYRIARLLQDRAREFAILTCRWPPRISSTTRAGPTSWSTWRPGAAPFRSAWWGR